MDCRELKNILPAYLEGDLEDSDALKAENHLSSCESCRMEMDAFKKSWQVLDVWDAIEPGASFEDKFWEAAEKPGLMDRFLSVFSFRVPAWAVAVLLIISFWAGFVPASHHSNMPRQTAVVYLPVSESEFTETTTVPGHLAVSLPTATQILKDDTTSTDADILPTWDEDYTLNRIDIDTIFDSAGS